MIQNAAEEVFTDQIFNGFSHSFIVSSEYLSHFIPQNPPFAEKLWVDTSTVAWFTLPTARPYATVSWPDSIELSVP
jgi:hypothetical protein